MAGRIPVLGNLSGIGRPAEGAALVRVRPAGNSVEAEFVPELGAVMKLVVYDISTSLAAV